MSLHLEIINKTPVIKGGKEIVRKLEVSLKVPKYTVNTSPITINNNPPKIRYFHATKRHPANSKEGIK
jgi:hypothetical protein